MTGEIKLKLLKPIALVGMMGVGKSHIGHDLSKQICCKFYDSDALIERDQGRNISQIFKEEGEAFFRDLEADKIHGLLAKGNCIISTGGGALLRDATLQEIKAKAISVWLKSDVDIIFNRIKNDNKRPLLQSDNPKQLLADLLKQRQSLYEEADIHVDNSTAGVQDVVGQIIQELHKYEDC